MTLEFNVPANSGPASFFAAHRRMPVAEPVPFQTVPMNLSAEEIRALVRELLG
ncbi:MAG: hypothetical protein ACRYGM_28320 [Janthinobacterium lividum]